MKLVEAWKKWFGRGPSQSETQLLRRCHGDTAQLERLIGYELARRPRLSRARASQAALERWNRDR